MKKLLSYAVLAIILTLNVAASCSDDNDNEEPKPDQFSLVGKWFFWGFEMNETQPDGSVKNITWLAEDKKINIFWTMKSNGEFIATQDLKTANGRWELQVSKTEPDDPTLISEGKLTISGVPGSEDMSEFLGSPELTYNIRTGKFFYQGKPFTLMVCEVDATKQSSNGLKTILKYSYLKQ